MPSRHSACSLPLLSLALAGWLAGCQDAQLTEVESPVVRIDRSALASCRADALASPRIVPQHALYSEPFFAARQAVGQSGSEVVRVQGAGGANVTDEFGQSFTAKVAISALLDPGGAPHGSVNVVFDRDFSAFWGAVPGTHSIHLAGKVAALTSANGTITLTGTAVETDIVPGGAPLVFKNEPLSIVISAPNRFSLQWCALPSFDFQMTSGSFAY